LAVAQNATITMQVLTLAGANKLSPGTPPTAQPAPGVSIYVLAGANKFSAGMPPTGTTNSTGAFVFPPGLLSATKSHTQMEVYEVCVNGEKAIFVISKGTQDQLPKDTGDCQKRYLGFFWLDGGPNVVVDLTNSTVTQTGGGLVAGPPQGNPLISVAVGGGVGFKNIGGTSGDRAPFLNSFPGGTFSTSANTFAGDVGSSIGIGPAVFDFNAWRANGSDSKGSGPVLGGGTDTALITQQFQGFSVTAGGKIPLGRKASFIIRGGGNFWHANIDTKETVANGTTGSTVANSRGVDGRGWTTGAALQVDMSRRWSVVFRWDYIPMSNAGVNIHLNEGSIGVMFRLFGVPGK
jgi:hypothetical protein